MDCGENAMVKLSNSQEKDSLILTRILRVGIHRKMAPLLFNSKVTRASYFRDPGLNLIMDPRQLVRIFRGEVGELSNIKTKYLNII